MGWWSDLEVRLLDALRSPAAMRTATQEPTGDLASFRRRKNLVLVSYRRDGTPVPSPLWFGEQDGKLYTHTGGWKLRRIAARPHVRIAPCTFRGRPLGPPLEATARVLPPEDHAAAEAAVQSNFGLGRRLYYGTVARGQREIARYLEITPDGPQEG